MAQFLSRFGVGDHGVTLAGLGRALAPLAVVLATVALPAASFAAEGSGGGGLPQLNVDTFASQLFWLFATFIAFYFLMANVGLPKVRSALEERDLQVSDDLAAAEKFRKEAEAVKAEYEAHLADARSKAHEALAAVAAEADKKSADQNAELDAKLEQELKAAEARISAARDEALANIRVVAAEVATAATDKLIGLTPTERQLEAAMDKVMKKANAGAPAGGDD